MSVPRKSVILQLLPRTQEVLVLRPPCLVPQIRELFIKGGDSNGVVPSVLVRQCPVKNVRDGRCRLTPLPNGGEAAIDESSHVDRRCGCYLLDRVSAMIAAFSLLSAGLMADRPGKGVLRLPAGVVLAGAVGSLPFAAATHIAIMGAVLALAGVAAASVVKTSLETAREEGAIVGIGFLLLAVLCATGLLGMFGGTGAQNLAFTILPGVALLHLASLALALLFTRANWAAAGFTARATESRTMFATK